MAENSKTRQTPSPDTIVAIRAALFEPVLKSRHLRSTADVSAPLRLGKPRQSVPSAAVSE
ncbi:hypothetical protein [Beijerinckia sp. L45]|uniref:hypothetical protein n=1 Tax=Beijerinckia sp. L45 TaxID=1641855 RepID=UPI00131CC9B6|nr:hypothetical protein [Beijerinckia sp. L45]